LSSNKNFPERRGISDGRRKKEGRQTEGVNRGDAARDGGKIVKLEPRTPDQVNAIGKKKRTKRKRWGETEGRLAGDHEKKL